MHDAAETALRHHCRLSISPVRPFYGRTMCERRALAELDGLGDPGLGEWREWSGAAFHLRRRLSPDEERRVGPAVDVRHTPEAVRRAAALGDRLALLPQHVLDQEIGPSGRARCGCNRRPDGTYAGRFAG